MTSSVPDWTAPLHHIAESQYVAWPLANIVYLVIYATQKRVVTVEPGQGGRVEVFIWPSYWGWYDITDLLSAPEYSLLALCWNYFLGVVPIFFLATVLVNATFPDRFKRGAPTIGYGVSLTAVVCFAIAYVPANFGGFDGVLLWLAYGGTLGGTIIWNASSLVRSDPGEDP